MSELKLSVDNIKGIGEKKKKLLSNIGLTTIEDLIYYFPVSYEDRRKVTKIKDFNENEIVSSKAMVKSNPIVQRTRRNMVIVKILVSDGSESAYLTFFNQAYRTSQFKEGDIVYFSGKVKNTGVIKEIVSPEISMDMDNTSIGKIKPIYGLTKGISNLEITKYIKESLKYLKYVLDIPEYIRKEYDLLNISDAIEKLHFPSNRSDYLNARNTISFSELLILQMGLLMLKDRRNRDSLCLVYPKMELIDMFHKQLSFKLTNAQMKAIEDIERDMEAERQMNRLIQGDVGSGKTVVATFALLKAFKSGFQGAMMVPTEILARQHYDSLSTILGKFGISVGLVVSNMKAKEKREIIDKIGKGEIDVVVGTHALIEDYVNFKNLGLVITDEQHRFGVKQRAKLSGKSNNPDILVMTATPIPRTLALIVYGDLDITIIDELPPGRKAIKTYGRSYRSRDKVYSFVRDQVFKGRQAYVVCPMVEDSDTIKLQSAESVFIELKEKYKDISIGLLHGQMKSNEKDDIMEKFKNGEIDILVSTTVIEVGVNVPNSSVMVVENAERFGLAQLHQLRGRVGRGEYQSYCILLSEGKSTISKERINILEKTNDGFIISEKDLELRGPGEFFGLKQHGLPELNISKLPRDMEILSDIQILVKQILLEDPELKLIKNKELNLKVKDLIFDSDKLEFN